MISLDQEEYEELENNSLVITIVRSGDFALPITVYLTSIQVTRDNAALGKKKLIRSILINDRYYMIMQLVRTSLPELKK